MTALALAASLSFAVGAAVLLVHHHRFRTFHERLGRPVPVGVRWLRHELVDGVTIVGWYLRGFLRDGLVVPPSPQGRLVLFVHGYSQNATNFWGLRRFLEGEGRPTLGLSLHHRFAPMSWYARRLERRLERLAAQFPDGIDVVAHSMGGIVLRLALDARADLRSAVRTVVTLGSPHHGTAAADTFPVLPELLALRRRSELFARLPHLPALLPHAHVVTVAADADTLVYPVETALVADTHQIVVRDMGHAGLLTRPEVWRLVSAALAVREPERLNRSAAARA